MNMLVDAEKCFGTEKHLRFLQFYIEAKLLNNPEVLTKMESCHIDKTFITSTVENLKQSLYEDD